MILIMTVMMNLSFSDRAGTYHFGVVSVSDIPDDASGNEVWTLKANGFENPIL
jgi:hypothetical protein